MKFIKKYLGHLASPFVIGLVISAAFSYLAFRYYEIRHTLTKDSTSFFSALLQLHEKTIDWRLTDRGFAPGSERVAILAIDERSLEQEGRWPWPRDKVGRLVEKALEGGAKIVAFDTVFPEADQNSSIESLRHIKRELIVKSQLNSDLESLIEKERLRTDGDRSFAEDIREHNDQLVLGAYFDTGDVLPTFQDFCVDALYERSAENRYWKTDAKPVTVHDELTEKVVFPKEMGERLKEYVTLLEVDAAMTWFSENPAINDGITKSLEDFSDILPPETYPGLATLWLNNDIESARLLLEEAAPDRATPESVEALFERFSDAFEKKEVFSLFSAVRNTGKHYCSRFLSENDELLHREKYKEKWGDSSETEENFALLNWKSLAPHIQPAGHATHQPPAIDIDKLIADLSEHRFYNVIRSVDRWWTNIPLLASATKFSGHFNSVLDTDGTVRRSMLLVRRGNSYFPSLALKSFLLDHDYTAVAKVGLTDANGVRKGLKSLEVKNSDGQTVMKIPVNHEAQLMINYSGAGMMFPHVSAADILNNDPVLKISRQWQDPKTGRWYPRIIEADKTEFLKDKILILGATAIGVYDLRVTPFEENYPGVETHANALSNLLVEHDRALNGPGADKEAPGFLSTHPAEEKWMWALLLSIGILLSALLSYFGSLPGLGITALFLLAVYISDRFWFFKSGVLTTVVFPLLQISGTFVSLTFYKYFTEERKKRELKGTFEKYVSPAIVAEVLADPENIELGGKKMDLTVMFSDVRGFTTISEKLDPHELSDLLNSYLTPMTALVFKNKGTLDKYMGDAIMAFWGAPIHFNDHAKHACRCALEMLVKLKELQAEYRAKGLPEIDIGIGLNTGDMSVGNMGSETVRSYTVMGDSVNLGSRLEGINKEYGTRIIISEFTYNAVKDSFITREVDWVRVKGKAQPVRIFELISEGEAPADMVSTLEHFRSGFALYHERQFDKALRVFEEALKHKSDDPPSLLYVERCRDYLETPPPPDWDGVYNMKSK